MKIPGWTFVRGIKGLKWILGVSLVSAALASGAFYSWKAGVFKVREIELSFEKNSESFFEEYRGKAEKSLAIYHGRDIWSVGIDEVASLLQRQAWVESARVQRLYPAKLLIWLKPKKLSALIVSGGGNASLVAADGAMLPEVSLQKTPDLPVLRSPAFSRDSKLRLKAVQILESLPEQGRFSRATVSDVTLEKEGFWLSILRSGIKVRLGESESEFKVARIEKVLEYLDQHQMDARVIDADFSKKVLVKLRKDR